MRSQLHKLNSFKAETYDGPFFRVFVTFVPQATFRRHQLRVFAGKAVKTGTAQTVFTFDDETKCHWQFAERFLVGFDRRQSRKQIAFTV